MSTSPSWVVVGGIASVLLPLTAPASASLTLNEILYDPAGPDGDHEYVELHNSGPVAVSLDGVELLFLNGADPQEPRLLWRGSPGQEVPAEGWFVVGEPAVEEADARSELSLQNGPDALWLRRGGEILDRVAWGEIEGLGEGSPAEDVAGQSLGRVPDGLDSGNNARDLRPLDEPTPGAENLPAVRWRLDRLEPEPPWLPRPGRVEVRVELSAVGWASTQSASVDLVGAASGSALSVTLAAGESRELRWWLDVDAHRDSVLVRIEAAGLRRRLGRPFRVGPAAVVLNEVMARPSSGEPEWVELHNLGSERVDLSSWALSDSDREPRPLGEGIELPPRGFVVLTADPEELEASAAVAGVRPAGGWPALNQSDGEEGFADELLLFDAEGRVVDHLRWTAERLSEAGRSLERALVSDATPSVWIEAPRGASPGRANDTARQALPDAGLQARPNPFSPDGDGQEDFLHVALRDAERAAMVEAEVFDLAGDRVRRLRAAGSGAVRQWIWDGRDERGERVPAGAYVLVLRPTTPAGRTWRRLVAVGYR